METRTVLGRQFRSTADYEAARRDAAYIETLKQRYDLRDREETKRFLQDIRAGKYRFRTILGKDLEEELEELLKQQEKEESRREKAQNKKSKGKIRKKKRKIPARPSNWKITTKICRSLLCGS